MKNCKSLFTLLMVALVVLLFAAPVGAQQLRNRVAPICTDVTTTATAQEAGFIPCDWYQTGTGPATPGYVRLVDQTTALMLDVQRLSTLITGLATTYNVTISASTMWLYNAGAGVFVPWYRRSPTSDAMTNAGMAGAPVLSSNFFYNPVTQRWVRWQGTDYTSDNVAAGVLVPGVNALLSAIRTDTGTAGRLRVDPSMRLVVGIQDPLDASGNVEVGIYDTSGNGPATFGGGAGAAGLRIAPPNDLRFQVSDDNNANTVGNTIHVELSDGAASFLDNTASPGYLRLQDNDSTVVADVLDSSTGATIASTLNGVVGDVRLRGWDGAAWAAVLIGAVGEVQVADITVRPGERAGPDDRAVFKKDIAVRAGPTIAGTAVTDASAVVCPSTYVLNLPNWSVFVKNAGGGAADAFTDVDVQISYDGVEWSSETSTACDTLAAGDSARCYKGATESVAYVQVIVDVAGGDTTTADCAVIGNKN